MPAAGDLLPMIPPLHRAIAQGVDVAAARTLLAAGADVAAVSDDLRETALHVAARTGALDVAALLMASGASLEATCAQGFTPTHAAAHVGHLPTLRLFLQARADPLARTRRGDSPLHLAALTGSESVIQFLLETAPTLLEQRNAAGWSALMLAVYGGVGRLGPVRALLERGARDTAPDPTLGWNAMLLACSRADHAVLGSLLCHQPGAASQQPLQPPTEAVTGDGHTPLMLSARAGSAPCVQLLLAAGANIDARNAHGLSALDLVVAAMCAPPDGDAAAVSDGAAAAMEAVVRLLLAAGAPPSAEASHGLLCCVASAPAHTPLRRLASLAALLRRAGCDDLPSPPDVPNPAVPAAADGVGGTSAALLAEQRRRPALAATLRAPRPAGVTLVVLRQPIDEPAPNVLAIVEGTPPLPVAAVEGPLLGAALARSWRKAKADSSERAAQLAEIAAMDAVALAGGAMPKLRRFSLLSEWAARDAKPAAVPDPSDTEVAAAALMSRERRRLAARAGLDATASALGAQGAAAVAAGEPRVLHYRQVGRRDLGAAELVLLEPQAGCTQVHEQHLAMLAALGVGVAEEQSEAERRPWCVYAEDLEALPPGAGEARAASRGVAHLFCLDAPLILSHVIQAGWGAEEGEEDAESEQ